MKNLKIRLRMLISYVVIIVLLICLGVISLVMVTKLGNSMQEFYDKQFRTTEYCWTARKGMYAAQAALFQSCLEDDEDTTKECTARARTEIDTAIQAVKDVASTFQGDPQLIKDASSYMSTLDTLQPKVRELSESTAAGSNEQAFALMKSDYIPNQDILRAKLSEIGSIADTNAENRVEEADTLTRTSTIIVIIFIIVNVVVAIFFALYISNSIIKPVNEISEASVQLAQGNMEAVVTYEAKDELGEMANELRAMMDTFKRFVADMGYCLGELGQGNLLVQSKDLDSYVGDFQPLLLAMRGMRDGVRQAMSQIQQASEQVNSGAAQVSSGAQALAQGATEQASTVQELSGSMAMISEQVASTADNTKNANAENGKSQENLQTAAGHMSELMTAMTDIENKSAEISKIVKSIEDIAFQTNILALNAAVEAARAGDAGKGFAVVAEEVRNLAGKSAEASKNTATLIEETVAAVNNGSHISQATNDALAEVVTSAEKVTELVQIIAQAAYEQSQAVAQVNVAIDQISSVVQTNAATAEESAAASEELSGQATQLRKQVARFRI